MFVLLDELPSAYSTSEHQKPVQTSVVTTCLLKVNRTLNKCFFVAAALLRLDLQESTKFNEHPAKKTFNNQENS